MHGERLQLRILDVIVNVPPWASWGCSALSREGMKGRPGDLGLLCRLLAFDVQGSLQAQVENQVHEDEGLGLPGHHSVAQQEGPRMWMRGRSARRSWFC